MVGRYDRLGVPVAFAGIEGGREASAPEPLGHRPDSPSLGPPKLQRLCTLERLLLDLEDAPKPLEPADDEPQDAGAAQHESPAVAHAGVIFEVNAITSFVFNNETLADGEKGRPVASDFAAARCQLFKLRFSHGFGHAPRMCSRRGAS